MSIILRIIGAFWILISIKPVVAILRRLVSQGFHIEVGLQNLLTILLLAGGIGLVLLREWGRWFLLIGAIGLLLMRTNTQLLQLKFPPFVINQLLFYGIFIVLLLIPQARAATKK
jgi:hypothetical protein